MANENFNAEAFAKMIESKRKWAKLSLRDAAAQMKISASTLSRAENKNIIDLITFNAICNWLNVEMNFFFDNNSNQQS